MSYSGGEKELSVQEICVSTRDTSITSIRRMARVIQLDYHTDRTKLIGQYS